MHVVKGRKSKEDKIEDQYDFLPIEPTDDDYEFFEVKINDEPNAE